MIGATMDAGNNDALGSATDERTRFIRLLHDEVMRLRTFEAGAGGGALQKVHALGMSRDGPVATTPLPHLPESGPAIECKDEYELANFLVFDDEDFVRNAYRGILGREPDFQGFSDYLAALRRGRYAKVEILGRLRYSREGRAAGVGIKGLRVPFAARATWRVLALGRVVGIIKYLRRLPSVVRNSERFEATVFENVRDTLRRVNATVAQIEAKLNELSRAIDQNEHALGVQENLIAEQTRTLQVMPQSIASAQLELNTQIESLRREKAERSDLEVLAVKTREAAGASVLWLDRIAQGKADQSSVDTAIESVKRMACEALVRVNLLGTESLPIITKMMNLLESQAKGIPNGIRRIAAAGQTVTSVERENAARQQARDHLHRLVSEPAVDDAQSTVVDHLGEDCQASAGVQGHLLDAFYVALENRFRGSREDIKARMAIYLPVVEEAGAGTFERPVLDLGCGRGEWLELLEQHGFVGRGIDVNDTMIADCRQLGFDVTHVDADAHLRALKSDSIGLITGMHIVEHMPFPKLLSLFDEALRVLRPGGFVAFETPNPENLIVGACTFYSDPTHQRPLPPELMRFVAESRGFVGVRVLRMHPYDASIHITGCLGALQDRVNALLYGPQDYAVIGRKA